MRCYYMLLEWLKSKKLEILITAKAVEQQPFLFLPGGNAKCHSQFGRQFGAFLQSWMESCHMIPQSFPQGIYPTDLKSTSLKRLQKLQIDLKTDTLPGP